MKTWWRDTLFKRLFFLTWAALVVSHVVALTVVTRWVLPALPAEGPSPFSLLALPPAPPMPLMIDASPAPHVTFGVAGEVHIEAGIGPEAGVVHSFAAPFPSTMLVFDYGIRVLVIGLSAWLGARWLSVPMRRLVAASRSLGPALQRGDGLPQLDERRGTVEVGEAAHVFNEMAGQLDRQFKSRALLVAAISHDLRTPLTRMRMLLETMSAEPAAQRCIASVREMNELIDTVFDVFRGASGAEPPQITDVFALVQSVTDDLAEQRQPVTLEGAPALANVDPASLRRVVSNLVGNALRYGERAQVVVSADAQGVHIVIDDFGPGIPGHLLAQVFEPFYRVEGSRNRHTGGIGLGLHIARDLVTRQGGTLTLANRSAGGLRAQVWLPPA
jgi:signal transduction histidine kinase